MLDGLDAIQWSEINDAYGPAVHVPTFIQWLLSDDPEVRRDGIEGLDIGICHQGSVGPATAPAVPFLHCLLSSEATNDRDQIALLLGNIARGALYFLNARDEHRAMFIAEAMTYRDVSEDEAEAVFVEMVQVHEAVHAGVVQDLRPYFALLDDQSEVYRMAGAYVLAGLGLEPSLTEPMTDVLVRQLANDQSDQVCAMIIFGLGEQRSLPERAANAMMPFIGRQDLPCAQYAAALVLAEHHKAETPRVVADTLLEYLRVGRRERIVERFWRDAFEVWMYADGIGLPERVAEAAWGMGLAVCRHRIADFLEAVKCSPCSVFGARITSVLVAVFAQKADEPGYERAALTDEQRVVLEAIVAADLLWGAGNSIDLELARVGLPTMRHELRALLAQG